LAKLIDDMLKNPKGSFNISNQLERKRIFYKIKLLFGKEPLLPWQTWSPTQVNKWREAKIPNGINWDPMKYSGASEAENLAEDINPFGLDGASLEVLDESILQQQFGLDDEFDRMGVLEEVKALITKQNEENEIAKRKAENELAKSKQTQSAPAVSAHRQTETQTSDKPQGIKPTTVPASQHRAGAPSTSTTSTRPITTTATSNKTSGTVYITTNLDMSPPVSVVAPVAKTVLPSRPQSARAEISQARPVQGAAIQHPGVTRVTGKLSNNPAPPRVNPAGETLAAPPQAPAIPTSLFGEWACAICTLLNSAEATTCETCGEKR